MSTLSSVVERKFEEFRVGGSNPSGCTKNTMDEEIGRTVEQIEAYAARASYREYRRARTETKVIAYAKYIKIMPITKFVYRK